MNVEFTPELAAQIAEDWHQHGNVIASLRKYGVDIKKGLSWLRREHRALFKGCRRKEIAAQRLKDAEHGRL